jgi:hypothetical protein
MILYIAATLLMVGVRFYDFTFQHKGFYFFVYIIVALFFTMSLLLHGSYLKKNSNILYI